MERVKNGNTYKKNMKKDIPAMMEIWNHVVEDANASGRKLNEEEAKNFCIPDFSAVAIGEGQVLGLYITSK